MSLIIRVVENGFIVEDGTMPLGSVNKIWAFQSAQGLAEHIHKWASENKKEITEQSRTLPEHV